MPSIAFLPLAGTPSNQRSFPFAGHLGLSPVVVEGNVLIQLSAPEKPLPSSRVEVYLRCYETRTSSLFQDSERRMMWEARQKIWEKNDSADWQGLGDWEGRFRLEVPIEAAKHVRSSVQLKEYRVSWKLEAVIYHQHVPGVGERLSKSIDLPLLLHTTPSCDTLPSSPSSESSYKSHVFGNGSSAFRANISNPSGVYGPGESIRFTIKGTKPPDKSFVKRVVYSVERKVEFAPSIMGGGFRKLSLGSIMSDESEDNWDDLRVSSAPVTPEDVVEARSLFSIEDSFSKSTASLLSVASDSTTMPLLTAPTSSSTSTSSSSSSSRPQTSSGIGGRFTSFFGGSRPTKARCASDPPPAFTPPFASRREQLSVPSSSRKDIVHTKILEITDDRVSYPERNSWELETNLTLPRVQGESRWKLGETGSTSMVTISFVVKATIIVSTSNDHHHHRDQSSRPSSSSSTASSFLSSSSSSDATYLIPLIPITITSTSASDRFAAITADQTPLRKQRRTRSSSGTRSSSTNGHRDSKRKLTVEGGYCSNKIYSQSSSLALLLNPAD